jgi:DNA-binding transcriptional ArsR family regulator
MPLSRGLAWDIYLTIRLTTRWFKMVQDRLSSVFSALADPTRRGVLARLASGDATVKELAEPYEMSVAAVSKHLKVLEAAGLISQGRQSQWRPRHLEARPLQEVFEWLEDYRRFWNGSLDSLAEHLRVLQMRDIGKKRDRSKRPRRARTIREGNKK